MHRQELLDLLSSYQTRMMDESAFLAHTRRFVEQHTDCFERHLAPGHVTGSAWVVNPDRTMALILHHRKLDQWFQPGGHADGDNDIVRVALKETSEETGVEPSHIRLVSEAIFDIDIHKVPATHQDPTHLHYDIRFLVEMDDDIPIPGNDESHEILWVPLYQVSRFNNNRSTYRMVEKTRHMRLYP